MRKYLTTLSAAAGARRGSAPPPAGAAAAMAGRGGRGPSRAPAVAFPRAWFEPPAGLRLVEPDAGLLARFDADGARRPRRLRVCRPQAPSPARRAASLLPGRAPARGGLPAGCVPAGREGDDSLSGARLRLRGGALYMQGLAELATRCSHLTSTRP